MRSANAFPTIFSRLRSVCEIVLSNSETGQSLPQDNSDIQAIEIAAGKFKGLAVTVAIEKDEKKQKRKQSASSKTPSSMPVSRRTLIYGAIGTSVAIGAGAARWYVSQPQVKWKMVSFLRENAQNLILYKAPQMICDRIKEMTNGEFTIELDRSEKIETEDILKKVSNGEIECGYSGIYYNDAKYKVLFFGCAIPFGLNPQEQNAWLLYKKDPNDELTFIQGIYRKLGLNVIPFPAGGTGAQMGGWFKEKIDSVADFKGLTMRIPGLGAEVLRDYFGVKLDKDLPGGAIQIDKMAENLDAGNLKAAEWIGPYDDIQLRLQKVARYYYYPGWWEPSTTFDVQVNTDA